MPRGTREEHDFASGYASSHRAYEWAGITAAILCAGWLFFRVWRGPLPLSMLAACVVGAMLFADFVSGFTHWAFDTWGSTRTPVVGQLAIRTFREHHSDQKAITRHDFIETNGHNFALSVVTSGLGLWVTSDEEAPVLGTFLLVSSVFVAMTSQIHKWAHMDRPPAVIRVLQRARVFITPEHHATHHTPPYTRHYCITTGWLNVPLRAVRFFETLEAMISSVTGAVPRRPEPEDTAPEALDEAPQPEEL